MTKSWNRVPGFPEWVPYLSRTFFITGLTGLLILNFCLMTRAENLETESPPELAAGQLEAEAAEMQPEWSKSAFNKYIDLYARAADLWEKAGQMQKAADCYRKSAYYENLLGNYQSALLKLKAALKIEDAAKSIPGRIKTLSLLADISRQSGRENECETYFKRALQLSSSTDDPFSLAMASYSAAEFYYSQRDFTNARKFYRVSLDHWKKIDGQTVEQAQTQVDYGYFLMTVNQISEARAALTEAEAKFQQLKDRRGLALTRIAIGHLYSTTDHQQSALKSYHSADQNFPEDMDFIDRARLNNGIGLIYEDFGECELSLQYRQKAFDLFKQDDYLRGQLATLPSLVKLSYMTGDEKSAAAYFAETERLSKQLNDEFYLAVTRKQVGDYYFDRHDDEKAVAYYTKILKTLERFDARVDFALIRNNLGLIDMRRKKYDSARRHFDLSLRISREVEDRFAEAATLHNLAKLEVLEKNDEKALELAHAAVGLTERLTSDVLNSKLTRTYLSNVYERYELYINLLIKMHRRFPEKGYDRQALAASERSRSRSMLEDLRLAEADFFRDADPQIVQREQELRNLLNLRSNELTELLSRQASRTETAKLSVEINELTDQLEAAKAELKQKSPIYSAIKNPPDFDVAEFQKRVLDENSLLLEFSFGQEESYLWLIGRDQFDVITLPDREMLETRIEKLRRLLISREKLPGEEIDRYQTRMAAAETEYWAEAQILSDQLFGQVFEKLSGKRLILVTDGKLQYFPAGALPVPGRKSADQSAPEPLLRYHEIVYEPSASTLNLLMNTSVRPLDSKSGDLLVFADPVFSEDDERLSSVKNEDNSGTGQDQTAASENSFRSIDTLQNLRRLAASRRESDAVMAAVGRQNATLMDGFAANRTEFLAGRLAGYKVLHLATHGFFDEERPELSALVLSQFDRHGNRLDGFIRLQDIYGLNLAADLVVLSACDTGIGQEIKGEGLESLTNGFLQSGARAVVSSRWKVDDEATFELMRDFYEELAGHDVTASEALRRARIRMMENPRYRSPFYWAAFTLQGDYRSRPVFSSRFNYSKYGLLLLLVGGLFGVYRSVRFFKHKTAYSTSKK